MRKAIFTILIAISLLITAGVASANPVVYEVSEWSPAGGAIEECNRAAELTGVTCGEYAYKIEWNQTDVSANNGEYDTGNGIITISDSTLYAFNWEIESDYSVCKVILKAGTGADIYVYTGDSSGSVDIVDDPAISHATFCFEESENGNEIPEFPTIALPIAAILGLAFFLQRRKE
jgi:hypothetical protein